MGSVLSLVSATVSTAFTAVVSIIFSIYLLLGKEKLGRQISLVMKTYLKPAWYSHLVYFLETLHSCFRRFVVGQCTEAVILGLLCMGGHDAVAVPLRLHGGSSHRLYCPDPCGRRLHRRRCGAFMNLYCITLPIAVLPDFYRDPGSSLRAI